MQPEERREADEDPGPHPARDPVRIVGQPADAVLDVVEGTGPAAARPEGLGQHLQIGPRVTPLEDHVPFLPAPLRACG